MELVCPKCGKVGKSASPIPAGKVVRCPSCKEAFSVLSPAPEASPVELPIVIDQPSSLGVPSIIREKKSVRGLWALVALMPCVFGGGVLAGRISSPKVGEPISTGGPTPSLDRQEDEFNRLINPVSTAAIYWSEPEATLREICVRASSFLIERKHITGAGEIAAMLTICGRAERNWRGEEKCLGAAFVVGLYVEMLGEGTRSEDAIRILANLHRITPSDQPNPTAARCDACRKSLYGILKQGKMISVENALDQMMSNMNLVKGNEAFTYHRQTD